jgi:hypothetical protein
MSQQSQHRPACGPTVSLSAANSRPVRRPVARSIDVNDRSGHGPIGRTFAAILLVALSTAGLIACERKAPLTAPAQSAQSTAAATDTAWQPFVDSFIEDYFKAQPGFAVQAGRHEFDGQLPDWSKAGIEKEIARLHGWRDKAVAFEDSSLTPEQRFQREYLLNAIDIDLFWQERAAFPFKNPAWYIGQIDPQVYLGREYAPLEKRMAAYIGYARAIPQVAANVRANLRTPLPKSFVERGIAGFGGFAEFYRNDVPKVFAAVQDAELQKQFEEANAAAAKAMGELKTWFESQQKTATDDFALGEALFAEMLRQTERVEVPVADLAAAGRADLERNLAALKEACAKFAPKAPVRACIDKMEAHKPKGGTVVRAREQLKELKAFLVEKQIVTIPGTEEARVEESPPYNRANFAYINIPGPYESGLPSTYFVAPPDPSWSAKEQASYIPGDARLLSTSAHEVWPGHFLQFLHSNRNASKLQSLWVGYAFAEGWAHYTEEMMWEEGLGNGDPEQHIGQLVSALLRDVRFLSAIGLHAQGMTLEESEKLFRESAFADPGTARQQSTRGTYDPAYLNYTLGKLLIRKLRADWTAKQSGQSADSPEARKHWRAFHDQFLSYGGPPIPLVRKQMLGDAAGAL